MGGPRRPGTSTPVLSGGAGTAWQMGCKVSGAWWFEFRRERSVMCNQRERRRFGESELNVQPPQPRDNTHYHTQLVVSCEAREHNRRKNLKPKRTPCDLYLVPGGRLWGLWEGLFS